MIQTQEEITAIHSQIKELDDLAQTLTFLAWGFALSLAASSIYLAQGIF